MNKNIYKLAFDTETKRWDYSKVASEEAYKAEINDPLFDPYDETVGFFEFLDGDEEAARLVNRWNRDIATGYREIHTCKDCGKIFFINAKEKDWYANKKFQLPKRCKSCRVEKKKKAEVNDGQ